MVPQASSPAPAATRLTPAHFRQGGRRAPGCDSVVSIAGTYVYTSAAGTLLHGGNGQSEQVTFTPADTTDYTNVLTSVLVNVAHATPQVSVSPVNITYGTALANGQLSGNAGGIVHPVIEPYVLPLSP